MSIWIRAHWPNDASHFQDSDEHDNAIANLEQLTDPILDAIEGSINHAAPDGDAIFPELRRRLDHIPRCPINPGDAFQIALQCIQDIGDYDFDKRHVHDPPGRMDRLRSPRRGRTNPLHPPRGPTLRMRSRLYCHNSVCPGNVTLASILQRQPRIPRHAPKRNYEPTNQTPRIQSHPDRRLRHGPARRPVHPASLPGSHRTGRFDRDHHDRRHCRPHRVVPLRPEQGKVSPTRTASPPPTPTEIIAHQRSSHPFIPNPAAAGASRRNHKERQT